MSLSELTGTAVALTGIIPLNKMGEFIEETTRSLLKFRCKRWKKHFDDRELLVAFDAQSGANYPIVSMVAPANLHDKLFLPQLVALAHVAHDSASTAKASLLWWSKTGFVSK